MTISDSIEQAAHTIRDGGVVAYPTEAVYGLGCDPTNVKAIQKILQIKQREKEKGLILIASDFSQIEPYLAELPEAQKHKVLASWPGPFTWLWPAKPDVSEWIKGTHNTIAVRVSAHPLVRRLCQACDSALISTSANPAGEEPARSAEEVQVLFNEQVDYLLEGKVGPQVNPTEIRHAISGELVRT